MDYKSLSEVARCQESGWLKRNCNGEGPPSPIHTDTVSDRMAKATGKVHPATFPSSPGPALHLHLPREKALTLWPLPEFKGKARKELFFGLPSSACE